MGPVKIFLHLGAVDLGNPARRVLHQYKFLPQPQQAPGLMYHPVHISEHYRRGVQLKRKVLCRFADQNDESCTQPRFRSGHTHYRLRPRDHNHPKPC